MLVLSPNTQPLGLGTETDVYFFGFQSSDPANSQFLLFPAPEALSSTHKSGDPHTDFPEVFAGECFGPWVLSKEWL